MLRNRNDELEASNARRFELETLYKLLRDLTREKGLEVLQLLKRKELSEVLGLIAPLVQSGRSVSPHPTAQAILPRTSSRLEYELTAAHPYAYPALVSSVDGVPLCHSVTESDTARSDFGIVSR